MDHRCISHPRKKNQRMPARTKWTIAIPRRPCKSWPKPGMKKLHSAANTLPPDPGPAIGLSSRTEHVVEEHRRLYSKATSGKDFTMLEYACQADPPGIRSL